MPVPKRVQMTAAALLLAGMSIPTLPAAARADDGVPVLGQAWSERIGDAEGAPVIISVHGVRRLEDSAVIYLSVANPEGGAEITASSYLGNQLSMFAGGSGSQLENVAAVDQAGGKAYAGLKGPGHTSCFCTKSNNLDAEPGQALVGYARIAQIPTDVTTVDVVVGQQVFPAIPVEDGALEPQLPVTQVGNSEKVVLGSGWPTPAKRNDPATGSPTDVPTGAAQDEFVFSVYTRSVTRAKAVRKTAAMTNIDLTADVLFAVDQARLTPAGKATVKDAAKAIKDAKVTGTITVTGHTDSTASDSYNLDLSRRRAESVAKALRPLVGSSVKLQTAGKGEKEPIASNDTDKGRSLNRRVTITLPKGN